MDEDGSVASGTQTPVVDEDDGDDFIPDIHGEEPDDELEKEDVEDGGDDIVSRKGTYSDDGIVHRKRRPEQRSRLLDLDSSPGPSTPLSVNRTKKSTARSAPTIASQNRQKVKVQDIDLSKPRTRGIHNFDKIGGQEVRLKDLFGPTNEALTMILQTRDHWETQETFPLKRPGSVRRSFFEHEGARQKETTVLKKWYSDIGKEVFAKYQCTETISAVEGATYMYTSGPHDLNVLIGPLANPSLHNLKKGSFLNVSDVFPTSSGRRSWLFHLGSKVQDAQWAINENSDEQYLAVAVEQTMPGNAKPLESWKAPAFSPTKPFAASIQIWSFSGLPNGSLNTSEKPQLRLVICTEWGAPKQLRWCPIQASEEKGSSENPVATHIGLLAGIWSDGRVRILDVSIPYTDSQENEPIYIKYTHAAFDVAMPQTIPSCLHWLSSASLAVATAAGTVAIWTLTRPETFEREDGFPNEPIPWFYQQLADTFILTISSGWPSQPQFLSISTADGFARLYDLRAPNADTTVSIRGRTLCVTQTWHEHTQSFIMPDEHYILKHNPIRRYYHNMYSMRLESSITRVATSPLHPGVLVGATDGTVEAGNPVFRIMNYKYTPYQQRWFVHEWRGPVQNMIFQPTVGGQDTEMSDGSGGVAKTSETTTTAASQSSTNRATSTVLSSPLARITEGYKATQPGIQHSVMSKKETNPEIGKGITVFEERSSITALAWNPNLKFGTWAVAGMYDGLLRVEDLGV